MRKTIYIVLAALGLCLFAGCGSSDKEKVSPTAKQLVGEWQLKTWTGETPQDFDIYLSFGADNTFEIYQRLAEVKYQKFTGSYQVQNDVLSGKYSGGKNFGSTYDISFNESGSTLTLTIDANIQHWLESALSAAVTEHHVAERGVGIVMDVHTGAVLAMSCQPDYDPNAPRTLINKEVRDAVNALTGEERSAALQKAQQAQWRNKAISDLYEPGSVFKLITAAAALDTGACKADDTFVCAGKISVAGTRFRCANGHIPGVETFAQGLAVSCNPCFIQIGARLGKENFCDYFAAFGLREGTGIDLPGEIKRSEYYTADQMGAVQDFGLWD